MSEGCLPISKRTQADQGTIVKVSAIPSRPSGCSWCPAHGHWHSYKVLRKRRKHASVWGLNDKWINLGWCLSLVGETMYWNVVQSISFLQNENWMHSTSCCTCVCVCVCVCLCERVFVLRVHVCPTSIRTCPSPFKHLDFSWCYIMCSRVHHIYIYI